MPHHVCSSTASRFVRRLSVIAVACAGIPIAMASTADADPAALPAGPLLESAVADVSEDMRFVPTTRPAIPVPQFPPPATTQNVDTNRPVHDWQRATDDWAGFRPWLDDRGVTINASLTALAGQNLRGGIRTDHGGFGYVFNLNVTLDTGKLFDWAGGSVFVNAQAQDGLEHSLDGAYQVTSHLYNEKRTQISEAWFQQQAFDNALRVRVGKIDTNGEFAVPQFGSEFLNASAACPTTILGMPTDPDPAVGLVAFIYPTDHLYAGCGVFDGSTHSGRQTGSRGISSMLDGDGGAFLIAEVGSTWSLAHDTLPGRFAVGAWHHTGAFDRFDGTTDNGASGPYVLFDQTLYRSHPDDASTSSGLGVFGALGYVDPSISTATLSITGGIAYSGIGGARPDDAVGLAVNYVRLSDQAETRRDAEFVVELFYKLRLLNWMSVKPDLQYVLHPADGDSTDALAACVQAVIDL